MVTSAASVSEIAARLEGHLRSLIGPRDPYLGKAKHQLAQYYMQQELGRWGKVNAQCFFVQGQEHCNWGLEIAGRRPQLAPILVGAHYDTVPGSPGADDNTSGLAVLLVLAELLAHTQPRRSVHLVAFDLEEYGLVGSTACAQAWKAAGRPLHLMLSLEMLGYFSRERRSQQYPIPALSRLYPDTGNFIALIGNAATVPKMIALKRQLKKSGAPCQWLPIINQGNSLPATRRSDHAPFWDEGYPALLITDTAELRNPHYHKASDRIETLNIEMMARITQGLLDGLKLL